ncbi:MAG: cation-transporting P-type ATPase [Sedimenticola sp.]
MKSNYIEVFDKVMHDDIKHLQKNLSNNSAVDGESLPLWHTLKSEEVFSYHDTAAEGLSSEQVEQRLNRYGYNERSGHPSLDPE